MAFREIRFRLYSARGVKRPAPHIAIHPVAVVSLPGFDPTTYQSRRMDDPCDDPKWDETFIFQIRADCVRTAAAVSALSAAPIVIQVFSDSDLSFYCGAAVVRLSVAQAEKHRIPLVDQSGVRNGYVKLSIAISQHIITEPETAGPFHGAHAGLVGAHAGMIAGPGVLVPPPLHAGPGTGAYMPAVGPYGAPLAHPAPFAGLSPPLGYMGVPPPVAEEAGEGWDEENAEAEEMVEEHPPTLKSVGRSKSWGQGLFDGIMRLVRSKSGRFEREEKEKENVQGDEVRQEQYESKEWHGETENVEGGKKERRLRRGRSIGNWLGLGGDHGETSFDVEGNGFEVVGNGNQAHDGYGMGWGMGFASANDMDRVTGAAPGAGIRAIG
ncbi:unnamed protein product [Closterium sp. NIES-65]|nr:unnamed protein product [Closterium sp. NIES-65]